MNRLFGTDGVRGVAGEPPLDAATVTRLGAAIVRVLNAASPVRLVIGRDTRESGVWIADALARGAAGAGALVTSAGVAPTPAVAYLAADVDFDLGVVISASHNPYQDNGIKVFSGEGRKFGDLQERQVEAWVAGAAADAIAAPAAGVSAVERPELVDRYLNHLRPLLPAAGRLAGSRIAIDLANGATTTTAGRWLRGIGFEVIEAGHAPDGRNINRDCGSTHPDLVARLVVERQCRIGVAFDGDGDRAIFVDHLGRIVDGDAVLLVLARRLHARGALDGDTVVATVMSNLGLEHALAADGIGLVRTPVGDKYVMERMLASGYVLGGEQSGHVIMAEHLHTGDGLATALAMLRALEESGRELADLTADFVRYPQVLLNVRVRERRAIADVPDLAAAVSRAEAALAGRGRVLVRYSGTEALLRVMIEGDDRAMIAARAEEIAGAARTALGRG